MLLDIRIKTDLYRHRKYKRLKRIVGSAAMEHLITFWCNVAEQCPNGALNGWSNEDIESAAEWYGDEGVFCDAMIQSEFLDVVQDGDLRYYTPHDWEENQPWVVCAKERSEAARKAGKASALARKEKYGTAQPPERSPNGSFENRSERLPNGSRTPSPTPSSIYNTPPTPPRGKSVLKSYEYPEWLNKELWADFCRMRSTIKKPITTERTITGLINALKRLTDQGYKQDEIIQLAIDKCWMSFYAPKDVPQSKPQTPKVLTDEEIYGTR